MAEDKKTSWIKRIFYKSEPQEEAKLTKDEYKEAKSKIKEILKDHKGIIRIQGISPLISVIATLADKLSRDTDGNFKPGWLYAYLTSNVLSGTSAELVNYLVIQRQVAINNQIQTSLHQEYDSMPISERNLRNPDSVINEQSSMKVAVNGYIGSKGQLLGSLISTSLFIGLTATTGGTANIALMAGVAAYSAVYGYIVNKKMNEEKIAIKNKIRDDESELKGVIRHMVANSIDRGINDPQKKEYDILDRKQKSYHGTLKKLTKILNRYAVIGTIAKGVMLATVAAVTWGNPANLLVATGAALGTYGAIQKCINSSFSIKEHIANFGNTYKKFRSKIKGISYGKEKIAENANTIVLDKVAFRHRSRDDINKRQDNDLFVSDEMFVIGKGITILSGASGAGKSSLVDLLLHSDDVTSGAIRIGSVDDKGNFQGKDYKDLELKEPTRHCAVALQGTEFPEMSVNDFIRMANPNADEEKVRRIMEVVNIRDDATDNSAISPTRMLSPTDKSISDGQKKRLNLARALIKDSPILILDEPTSGVDETARAEIVKYLNEIKNEKTIIYITHNENDVKELEASQAIDVAKIDPEATHSTIQRYDLTDPQKKEEYIALYKNRKSSSKTEKEEKKVEENEESRDKFKESLQRVRQQLNQKESQSPLLHPQPPSRPQSNNAVNLRNILLHGLEK